MNLYRYYLPTCLVLLLLILGCSDKSTTPTSPSSGSNDLPCLTAPNPDDIAGHELM